jgi:hypothetical protein
VVPAVSIFSMLSIFLTLAARCTAKKTDLDGGGGWRSHEHMEVLMSRFDLGTLWDKYGLIRDIIVCLLLSSFITYY